MKTPCVQKKCKMQRCVRNFRPITLKAVMRQLIRYFSSSRVAAVDYSHAVIGGGAVGLAVAAELSKNRSNKVIVIERNAALAQETTSRNSEVIHAGLYYPENSLKLRLCLEGKALLYDEAQKAGVEMRQCGKWVVAQTEEEREYLNQVHERVKNLGVPIEFVPLQRAARDEPNIKARSAVLNSPTTGIISAHSLVSYLESVLQENGGEVVVGSPVVSLEYNRSSQEYSVGVESEGETASIVVSNIINSGGLHACDIWNLLLPTDRHLTPYYAKGNYFSLTTSTLKVNRLIYPCPTKHVQSLGTHLTIDLGGQIKFGPDLEWVESCDNYAVNGDRIELIYQEVIKYFPSLKRENLSPSYSGIRPKLVDQYNKAFQDFVIREEEGFKGFVNLLGIESPGLTASMGIGKYVSRLL